MSDLISRQDAIEAVRKEYEDAINIGDNGDAITYDIERILSALPSADAEPKWNCTANFVAEQLEKLKDMTDEERIKLLHILFPSADAEPSLKAIKRQIDEHWYLDPPSAEPTGDLISRQDAIDAICKVWCYTTYGMCPHDDGYCKGCDEIEAIDALPSAVCDDCIWHVCNYNKVDWDAPSAEAEPSLKAIKRQIDEHWYLDPPSAEAVQGDGKMIPIELKKRYPHSRDEDITDAFMRGYQAHAEAVQVVRCKDCLHANECHKSVQYTRHELNTVTIGYSPIEWCSRGERKGGDSE